MMAELDTGEIPLMMAEVVVEQDMLVITALVVTGATAEQV
jgi:hypothetical protein